MTVLAIDAGTTGVRSIVFDESARVVGQSYRELTQFFPQPGWVEHDAGEICRMMGTTAREALAQAGRPIAAVGITNQRETTVVWDRRTGEPVHRALVWQDRRTAARCAELAVDSDRIQRITGLVPDPYFSATKIEWLLGNIDARRADLACGTVDSYLIWHLTNGAVHATDASNASRTMLLDIATAEWSDEMRAQFDVPREMLPDVKASIGEFGTTDLDGALGARVPISAVLGDQQAALFGQACLVPGMAKNTYGTGSFLLLNAGTTCPPPSNGLITTIAWQLPGEPTVYALEGAMFTTGAAIQWLRDGLGIIDHAADIGPLAASVADTGGVVVVPAFSGLGSPWWRPNARGAIVGLTRGTTRGHLARAVVESIAYQARDVAEAMRRASGVALVDLRVDGGASALDLLLQLQADQLGVAVTRAATVETTALGAAFAAGIGAGVWTKSDVTALWRADRTFEPHSTANRDVDYDRWLRAVTMVAGG